MKTKNEALSNLLNKLNAKIAKASVAATATRNYKRLSALHDQLSDMEEEFAAIGYSFSTITGEVKEMA